MDLNKLSQAEKIIAGSAVALLIFSFLPWFGLGGGSHSAWSNPLSSIAVMVGLLMLLQIFLARFSSAKLPKPPVPWGQVHLILGVIVLALVLLQAVIGDRVGALGFSVDLERKFGLFLGLLAAAGLAYGGFRKSKEPEASPGFMP